MTRLDSSTSAAAERFRETVRGSLYVFGAEALAVPTGLVIVGFLARRLGADGYGEFTLAAAIVAWIEWSVASALSRVSVAAVAQAPDQRAAGAAVVRAYLWANVGAAVLLWAAAPWAAGALRQPALAHDLRLFAFDIPLFGLAQAHRSILIGTGSFGARAVLAGGRWLTRMVAVVALVGLGFGILGAIVGSLGSSVAELLIARRFVRPPWLGGRMPPGAMATRVGLPLALFDLSMRAFDKVDLLCLMALTGSSAAVGLYGAAQNLSVAPGMFALSFSPLLLSTLTRVVRDEGGEWARPVAVEALSVVTGFTPFAAMAAGASGEITALVLGHSFSAAAPLFALLAFGALGLVWLSVSAAILTAAGKPAWAVAIGGPLLVLAVAGHIALIPRYGALAAACVTASLALLGALAGLVAVHRAWRVAPPGAAILRATVYAGGAYLLASLWSTPGPLVLLKLAAITAAIVALSPQYRRALLVGDRSARGRC